MKCRLYFFLFIFFSCKQTYSQDLSTYKKVNGLNSNTVYYSMQDSKGYLWVGTEAGVARYDGYKFIHYTIEDGLGDNDVFQIREDSRGRLWFLTYSGKPAIYENGHILNAANTSWLSDIQPKKLAKYFYEDKPNSIWYATLDTAYHIINDKVVEKFAPPQIFLLSQNIQTLTIYNDTTFLICNSEIFNTVTHKNQYLDSSKILHYNNTSVVAVGENIFYVSKNKLCYYSLKTHFNTILFNIPKEEVFLQILKAKYHDTVLLSTVHHLYKFNLKTQQVIDANISNVNSVTDIYADNEGNTWVASLTKGLVIKENNANKRIFKISAVGLPENTACYSFSKVDNELYIGYDDGYYLKKKCNGLSINKLKDTLRIGKVQQIFKFRNKLFCSFNHGNIIQLNNDRINVQFSAKDVAVNEPYIYAARSVGIAKAKDIFEREPLSKNIKSPYVMLTSQRTSRLLLVSEDSLFAGGVLGLQLLLKEKPVAGFPWHSNVAKASITKIIKTPNHHIAFSTENMGLGIIYKDTIFNITKQNGLLTNSINTINSSKSGLLWLATAKGIDKLTYIISDNKTISYKIENYNWILDKDNQNINDILQSNDTLFIATNKGAYYHLISQSTPPSYSPKVYIESLVINDSNYTNCNLTNLSYKENRFRINFIGLAFQANGNLLYRYKLDGVDTGWHYTTNTFVEYPYLAPNPYKFIVQAAIPNGSFSKMPATIEFYIKNPWWKKWWFIVATIFISIIIAFLIIRYFINNIRYKHKLANQKLELDKQVAELEHQALRLQMNPHFIFNAIYAIQGFYASGDIVVAKQYINKLAALVRMILQAGRNNTISLQDELKILTNYIELFALKYDGVLQYHFTTADNINLLQVNIPPMIIQPILENALLHGIASLREDATIDIHFANENNILVCTVTDNGIGRKKSHLQKNGIIKESLGLDITLKRLELLYEHTPLLPIIEIKDANEEQENTGTIVTLRIPIQ